MAIPQPIFIDRTEFLAQLATRIRACGHAFHQLTTDDLSTFLDWRAGNIQYRLVMPTDRKESMYTPRLERVVLGLNKPHTTPLAVERQVLARLTELGALAEFPISKCGQRQYKTAVGHEPLLHEQMPAWEQSLLDWFMDRLLRLSRLMGDI